MFNNKGLEFTDFIVTNFNDSVRISYLQGISGYQIGRIEYIIKSFLFGAKSISCVPPNFYAQRMLTFLTSCII